MKKETKRLTVYPDPRALVVLGQSAPTLNRALESWARVVGEATEELKLSRSQWNYLADCLNGHVFDSLTGPGALGAEVRDAERYDGFGEKWDVDAVALAEITTALSWEATAAVIAAVQFFWEHYQTIDPRKDEWWTLRFRRSHREAK